MGFHDYEDSEHIIKKGNLSKNIGSVVGIYPQSPEEVRENKKRLFDLKSKYDDLKVETKVVGERLVFQQSDQVYLEKVPIPKNP